VLFSVLRREGWGVFFFFEFRRALSSIDGSKFKLSVNRMENGVDDVSPHQLSICHLISYYINEGKPTALAVFLIGDINASVSSS
jgi:hypothetical protein